MSKKMSDLYANLHVRLDTVGKHLKGAMAQLQSGSKETEAEIRAKLDAAKTKVAQTKADAEATKVRLQELAEAKKAEVKEQVTEWKAKHQKDKLEKRADRAEKYTVSSSCERVSGLVKCCYGSRHYCIVRPQWIHSERPVPTAYPAPWISIADDR